MRFYRLLTLTTTIALWLSASSTKAQNPYESLGVKVEPLTLSKGKYVEFFDKETVVQIGTVLFNTETNQVVAFLKTDTLYSESNLSPEIISRWLSPDPLAKEFPSWSPYNFCENNPILMIDPTGLSADSYVNLAGDNLGVDKDGANGVTRIVSNQEWNSITSKNNSTSEEGTQLLRQTSSKNPILFDNENVAYNYLDKNSKNANGSWNVENAVWLTTGGVVALPTTGNTSNEATLFGAKEVGNSGRYSFKFANRTLGIKGSIHTHPPGSVKTDQWDIDASKYGPSFIMNNDKVWLNFYHGGYNNPKGLVSSSLMDTKTLINDKRYSLIKYTDKAYWNQYYK